jgi:hypothetical protein
LQFFKTAREHKAKRRGSDRKGAEGEIRGETVEWEEKTPKKYKDAGTAEQQAIVLSKPQTGEE